MKIAKESLASPSWLKFRRNIKEIVRDFDRLETKEEQKPKVGLVGRF